MNGAPPPVPPRRTRPAPPPLPPRPPPPIPPKNTRPVQVERKYSFLTPQQVSHFLTHGFLILPRAFTPQKAAAFTANLWPRLGFSPTDRSTWTRERIHLPPVTREHCSTFSPAAWGAICELLGGADRVDSGNALWSDAFIVNLGVPGSAPTEGKNTDGGKLWDWHVDGDFFVHFLDSREQALLVIPVFSDISEGGGGTVVAPEGIGIVARYLYDHPEGVPPAFGEGGRWFINQARRCQRFVEITGNIGDVVLLHPFMLHSASRNYKRIPRVITNPRVGLKRPFAYGRDGSEVSLVERKTLMELGMGSRRLEWCSTGERRAVVPERVRKLREEEERKKRELGR